MKLQTTQQGVWECMDCIDKNKLLLELEEKLGKLMIENGELIMELGRLRQIMKDILDYA